MGGDDDVPSTIQSQYEELASIVEGHPRNRMDDAEFRNLMKDLKGTLEREDHEVFSVILGLAYDDLKDRFAGGEEEMSIQ